MLRRLCLLGLVLLCVASCSAGSLSTGRTPDFQPPKWSRVQLTTPIAGSEDEQLAGWNGGYLMVGGHPVDVRSSPDGRTWRSVTPPDLTNVVDPTADGRTTVGYGTTAYVVGWGAQGLAVWVTMNGTQWHETPLDVKSLAYSNDLHLDVSIAAGPRGVFVVANDAETPPRFSGFYIWRSFDSGKTFGQVLRVRLSGAARLPDVELDAVSATADGFMVSGSDGENAYILATTDGLRWIRTTTANSATDINVASPIGENDSSVVAFNDNEKTGQPLAIYQRDGTWRASSVDPGRLPDAGVVPVGQWSVNALCNWESGFIAIGNINRTGTQFSGMVWYSADGSSWTRQPVRDNGFDKVSHFMAAAQSNGRVLIVGYPVESQDLLMWQTDSAS